jgi:segregation and condensation protein A
VDNAFNVRVGEFEGPFDLLLSLIEERKMHISDVSLAAIADDFVTFIKEQATFPAEHAASFILTAATLLLLKSRALLPVFTLTEEEEGDVQDLEHRLSLYQVFRDVARSLQNLTGRIYFGGLKRIKEPLFSPAPDMSVAALHESLLGVLAQAPVPEKRPEKIVQSVVTLEEMMIRLGERVEKALSTTFKDFVGSAEDKREIVVGFLAVLELVKRGMLLADQLNQYGDISLEYAGTPSAPKYQ